MVPPTIRVAPDVADATRLARGFLTVTGARFLGLLLTVVQVKLAVTYLGPTSYGLLLTATLFVQSFGAWTEFGVGSVIVRRVSGRGADLQHSVGLSMAITLLLIGPLLLVTTTAGYLLYQDTPIVVVGVLILAVGLLFQSWATCYNPVAQVTGRFGRYAAADFIGRTASIVTVILAITFDGGLTWFFVAQLMVPLGQLVAMLSLGVSVGRFRPVWSFPQMKDLIRETLPMTYILVVGVLYFTVDGVMLSMLSTPEQVGAYGLAYKTIGNLTVVSTAMISVMAARFAADAAISPTRLAQSLGAALRAIAIVAVPVATVIWPFSEDIVRFLGSEPMVPLASLPMAVVAVAVAIGMVSALISQALIAAYLQGILTALNTFNLVLNIVLNLVLIPRFGAVGAAISLLVSELVGLVVVSILTWRRYPGFVPTGTILRLVPAVFVTLGVEYLSRDVIWWVRIILVAVVWAAMLLALKVAKISELRQVLGRDKGHEASSASSPST